MKKVFPLLMLMIVGSLVVFSQEQEASEGLQSMAQTERAFAKLSVEKGVREAFITFFADDGVNFQPGPVNAKESFAKQPAPANLPPFTLNWAPTYGGVSQSADLGYSTGPYRIEDHSGQNRSPVHGLFFSIWKKQSNGDWRVMVDMGVRLETAFSPLDAAFQPAPNLPAQNPSGPKWKTKPADANGTIEDAREALLKTDQAFFDLAKSGKAGQAWRKFLSEDARIYRQMKMPVIGSTALQSWIDRQDAALDGKPIKSDVSKATDLGYCYGSYESKENERVIEKGYYTRVWRRDAKGSWRIVFDVSNSLPAGEK
jgi:ketosteroid isomerase-like protein